MSSCSGGYAVAPSTPKPPALVTAATTSRQWLNAKSGNSISNCSQMAGLTPPVWLPAQRRKRELGQSLVRVDRRPESEPVGGFGGVRDDVADVATAILPGDHGF